MSNTPLEQEIHNIKASCYTNLSLHPYIDQNSNIQAYKSQNNCRICRIGIKKSTFSKTKKFYCKFCYNAVCVSCSNLKCFHPLHNKTKRICIACFNEAIKKQVKDSTKDLISKYIKVAIEESKSNIGEINSYEDRIDYLKEEICSKRNNLAKASKEIEEFNKYYETGLYDQIKHKAKTNLEVLLNEKMKKLKGFESIAKRQMDEINSAKGVVTDNEIQISGLRKEKERLMGGREEVVKSKEEGYLRCLEILRNQITLNTGMANTLRRDVENMKGEMKDLSQKQGCLIH